MWKPKKAAPDTHDLREREREKHYNGTIAIGKYIFPPKSNEIDVCWGMRCEEAEARSTPDSCCYYLSIY